MNTIEKSKPKQSTTPSDGPLLLSLEDPPAPPSSQVSLFDSWTPQKQKTIAEETRAKVRAAFDADKMTQTVIMLQNQDSKTYKKFSQLCKADQENIAQLYNKDDPKSLSKIQHSVRISAIAPKGVKIKEFEDHIYELLPNMSDRVTFWNLPSELRYEVSTLYWKLDIANYLERESHVEETHSLALESKDFLEKYKNCRFLIYAFSTRKQKLINDMRPKINDYFKKVKAPPIDMEWAYKILKKVKSIVDKYPAPKTDHTGNEETIPTSKPAEESTAPASSNSRDAVPAEIMGANHSEDQINLFDNTPKAAPVLVNGKYYEDQAYIKEQLDLAFDFEFNAFFSFQLNPEYKEFHEMITSRVENPQFDLILGILRRIHKLDIYKKFLKLNPYAYNFLIGRLDRDGCYNASKATQHTLTGIEDCIINFTRDSMI